MYQNTKFSLKLHVLICYEVYFYWYEISFEFFEWWNLHIRTVINKTYHLPKLNISGYPGSVCILTNLFFIFYFIFMIHILLNKGTQFSSVRLVAHIKRYKFKYVSPKYKCFLWICGWFQYHTTNIAIHARVIVHQHAWAKETRKIRFCIASNMIVINIFLLGFIETLLKKVSTSSVAITPSAWNTNNSGI